MDTFDAKFSLDDVEIVARQPKYDGFFRLDQLTIRHRLFAGGWSQPLNRELFIRDDAVCVLLYDPWQDAVVLIEQFRIGALEDDGGPWLLELVAGIVEPGESIAEVAHREAMEEAGADILELLPICACHVSPGGSQEYIHLFCAKVDSAGLNGYYGLEHEGEDIRVSVVSRQEAYAAVECGRINNAQGIMALQWLQLKWSMLQDQWITDER